MATLKERITAVYANSTPEGQELLANTAHALVDQTLLVQLESGRKPLSREYILNAIVEATLRHPAWKAKNTSRHHPA